MEQNEIKGTLRVTELKDGRVRIEAIGRREFNSYIGWMECLPAPLSIDGEDARVGDEGCFAVSYNTIGDEDPFVWLSRSGLKGNMGDARRIHGWRGTTNNRSIAARGWRKVESIQERKRGLGWVATLSPDLRPDEE